MKFFIVSVYGSAAGLAWKIQGEGHDVCIYIKKDFCRPVLQGMVEHVESIEAGLAKRPDVVIFDLSEMGDIADSIRKRGFRVIGAGKFNDLLELDRTYGMDLAEKVGIRVPPFTVFGQNQIEEAIKFIAETDGRYVLKPHGNLSLDLTYVSNDAEDMIHELEWIRDRKLLKGDFILQNFIKGIEISTEAWFSNGNPIPSLSNSTIERKKFMPGDLGQNTGCEASVVWPYRSDRNKIFEKTLWNMYPIIKKMKYTGPLDINCIISEEDGDPYFLEWTPRLGFSAIYAFAELIEGRLSDFFYNLSVGKIDDMELKNDLVSMALTLSISPYPLDVDYKENHPPLMKTKGKPVTHIPEEGFWPADVMLDPDNDQVVTAGTDCLIGYATSSGQSVEDAEDKLYAMIEDIGIPNVQYRVDGAMKAMDYIPELKDKGYKVPICKQEELAEDADQEDREEPALVGVEEEDD